MKHIILKIIFILSALILFYSYMHISKQTDTWNIQNANIILEKFLLWDISNTLTGKAYPDPKIFNLHQENVLWKYQINTQEKTLTFILPYIQNPANTQNNNTQDIYCTWWWVTSGFEIQEIKQNINNEKIFLKIEWSCGSMGCTHLLIFWYKDILNECETIIHSDELINI